MKTRHSIRLSVLAAVAAPSLSALRRLALCCLSVASTALVPTADCADTTAFSTTGGSTVAGANDTFGYTFTLASAVSVTRLGFFDYQSNGLSASVPVTIWDSAGTAQASATVPAGVGTLLNGYIYVTLATPVSLAAGTYTIGGYVGSTHDNVQISTTITGAAGVTYGAPRSDDSNAYPTSDEIDFANAYFGPNFQFVVPEPSTWAAVLVGATLVGLSLRRHFCRT